MSSATTIEKKSSKGKSRGKKTKAPIARTVRKLVGSFGGLIDGVVARGASVERDTRTLVRNLVKSPDEDEKKGRGRKNEAGDDSESREQKD